MPKLINTGEVVVMQNAGGWGYAHDNNGCLALIDHTGTRDISQGDNVKCQSVGGIVLNPISSACGDTHFYRVPVYLRDDGYTGTKPVWSVRHASLEEILDFVETADSSTLHKQLTQDQWSILMEAIGELRKEEKSNTNKGFIEIEI